LTHLLRHTALIVLAALPVATPAASLLLKPARTVQSAQDSARLYRYGEVVVSADRYPVSAEKAGAVSYDIPRDPAWEFGGPGGSLAAGRDLHLAPYGGGMALQTLSIRGMGAEHTLFLWNGMPAGNMQTGVSDVNLFSAADIGSIQVVPGGSSAIHGAAAVGGVVNLVPLSPLDAPPAVEIGATAGSFGEAGMFVRGRVRPSDNSGLSVRAASTHGRGEYPFADPATGADAVRLGCDYASHALNLSAGLDGAGQGRFGMIVSVLSLEQGTPGPWTGAAPEPDARRKDQRLIAGLSYELPPGEVPPIAASAMVDMQYERYLDPAGIAAADNYYRTTWAGASGQFRRAAGASWLFQAGTEFRYERAAGNAIDSTRERVAAALSASVSWIVREGEAMELTITPSLRAEGVSSFAPRYSPRVGLNAEWTMEGASLRVHGSAAGANRNPTMNELWYAGEGGRGNPGLGGESAVSFDAGIGGRVPFPGELTVDVSWYRIGMTDRIQWVPTANPRVWSPINLGETRSSGWEVGGRWKAVPDRLEFDADYSLIDSKRSDISPDGTITYAKQLTYVPLDKGSAGILIGVTKVTGWLDALTGMFRIVYTGVRYTLDDNSASLPDHTIAEAGASAKVNLPWGIATIRYSAGNLASIDYQVMPGYPMPRFHHSLSMIWNIGV
jgi:vitamin B12 transporter